MSKVDINTYYIMPINEMEEDYKVKDMYALYTSDDSEKISIAILDPELVDMPAVANIGGLEDATDVALFVDAIAVTDRPIYKIKVSTNRTVAKYDILNDYDIELRDIVTGKNKVEPSQTKK